MYLKITVINKNLTNFKKLRDLLNEHGFFINSEYSDDFIEDCINKYIACPNCKEVKEYNNDLKHCNKCGYKG